MQAGDLSGDSSNDDDEEDEDERVPGQRHELSMRLSSIVDIIKKLYELGFKIRDPRLRPSSLKANLYREVDPDTGVDLFEAFAEFDRQHVCAFLNSVRQGRAPPAGVGTDSDGLEPRLASSITLRRKHFRYWEKHGKKLSLHSVPRIEPAKVTEPEQVPPASQGQREEISKLSQPVGAGEQKTLMSMTEATKYHEVLDDRTESGTVISSTSTALDADGHGLELPNPPPEVLKGRDFVCPYCSVVCPAKYGRRKAWRSVPTYMFAQLRTLVAPKTTDADHVPRSHVLHDLQPYICTYQTCSQPHHVYRSRREWAAHESSEHRRRYRCYAHADMLYENPDRLKAHLQREHASHLTDAQMDSLVGMADVGVLDERPHCPICFELAPFSKGLENHLAHHLERLAIFALPRHGNDAEEDAASTADTPDSQKACQRSFDSGRSLDPPEFSDHGAPDNASTDNNPESGSADGVDPRHINDKVAVEERETIEVIQDTVYPLSAEQPRALDNLSSIFSARTGSGPRREVLLHGRDGVGKTTVAWAFSEIFKHRYVHSTRYLER
jgi:hypothetical protein